MDDAALLFGGAKDAALTKGQAIDALSAMGIAVRWVHGTRCPGICYRDSDADALLGDEVNAQELLQIASKLKLKNITKDEFMKLVHVRFMLRNTTQYDPGPQSIQQRDHQSRHSAIHA